MIPRRWLHLGHLMLMLGALLFLTVATATLVEPHLARTTEFTVGRWSAAGMLFTVASIVALIVAAGLGWAARPWDAFPLIAVTAAAAWLAAEPALDRGVSSWVRSVAAPISLLAVPLLVHLPLSAARVDGERIVRRGLVLLYLITLTSAIGRAVTWDPFYAPTAECIPVCAMGDNILLVHRDLRSAGGFQLAATIAQILAGLSLVAWAGWRSRRASPGPRLVLVSLSSVLLGAALAMAGVQVLLTDPRPIAEPAALLPALALTAAVCAVGIGVATVMIDEGRWVVRLRRLARLLAAGGGRDSLQEVLAVTLGDRSVRVVYPASTDGESVDAAGERVPIPQNAPGRAVTTLERGGRTIAYVAHAAAFAPGFLTREVGAAARLAVDNERLSALLRAQVRELQASRERIVAAGDAARGRLERDLHDGAQQRLLAVSYELRLAQAAAGDAPPERRAALATAVAEIDHTLVELRELAHGIWPAVLAEAGLEAALGSLADEAPIPVTLDAIPEQRFPARTEAAAYLAVTEALRRATAAGASGLHIRATATDDRLELEAHAPGLVAPGPWLRVDDRVGAAGGRSAVTSDPVAGTLLRVELPCA